MYAIFSKYRHYLRIKAIFNPRNAKIPSKEGIFILLLGKYSARQHHGALAGLDGGRQLALSLVRYSSTAGGAGAASGDGPDHEALPTAGITAHEHAVLGGGEPVVTGDVATLVEFDRHLVEDGLGVRGRKPTEMRTRSAGSTRSVPGWRVNGPPSPGATETTFRPVT